MGSPGLTPVLGAQGWGGSPLSGAESPLPLSRAVASAQHPGGFLGAHAWGMASSLPISSPSSPAQGFS